MKNFFMFLFVFSLLACGDDDGSANDGTTDPSDNGNANLRSTGDSAAELLRGTEFSQLEVELIFVNNARPERASLNNLMSFMEQRLNKPGGINFIETNITDDPGDTYTIEEIDDLDRANRSSFTRDNTIGVSIIFVDKSSDRDEGNRVVLGTAYRNTSLVMFQSTIERFSGAIGQPSRINLETTVYNHEFAHLLGLVNLGTPLQSPHEDEDNENHCNVPGCLMFFEVNGGNILDMMNMSSIPELDPQCVADLRANGGR